MNELNYFIKNIPKTEMSFSDPEYENEDSDGRKNEIAVLYSRNKLYYKTRLLMLWNNNIEMVHKKWCEKIDLYIWTLTYHNMDCIWNHGLETNFYLSYHVNYSLLQPIDQGDTNTNEQLPIIILAPSDPAMKTPQQILYLYFLQL